jgi:hypothetical protein
VAAKLINLISSKNVVRFTKVAKMESQINHAILLVSLYRAFRTGSFMAAMGKNGLIIQLAAECVTHKMASTQK